MSARRRPIFRLYFCQNGTGARMIYFKPDAGLARDWLVDAVPGCSAARNGIFLSCEPTVPPAYGMGICHATAFAHHLLDGGFRLINADTPGPTPDGSARGFHFNETDGIHSSPKDSGL